MIKKISYRVALSFIPIIVSFVLVQILQTGVPVEERLKANGEFIYKSSCRTEVVKVSKKSPDSPDQLITIRINNGNLKGHRVSFENIIYGNPYNDKFMEPGDRLFCEIFIKDGKIWDVKPIDFIRIDYIIYSVGIFFITIIMVCGKKSLAIISSLIVSFFLLYCLVELIKRGFDPIVTTIMIVILLTLITFKFIANSNIKVFSSASGTILSLTVVGLVTYVLVYTMKYTGLEVDIGKFQIGMTLWGIYGPGLDYQKIIVAGIIFGALGAVMDISVVVASAVNELKTKYKHLTFSQSVKSGFAIGRDVIGTTSNTLVFAYATHDITLLVLIYIQSRMAKDNFTFLRFLCLEGVSVEAVRIIMGSIGIVLAVPVTVWAISAMIELYETRKE